ncbi:MAG TPA: fatty acid desaturase [Candidatus Eisenbacteria bacterium]|nr:fatty acid desaturase [Candidatus Eisenbacteria bacterium]
METGTKMTKGINWLTLFFFSITTAGALAGAPLYVRRYGISPSEVLLALFFVIATGMSITVGYHRLYAHASFKTNKVIEFLILFFGAAAFEQSALTWSSGHRDHHRYVDTEMDPYSIKKGFWYAHIGWMTLWKQIPDYSNAKDLMKNKLLMHQHDHYAAWGVFGGILLPVILGALGGHALGALVFSVCVRLTLVYHATFCINSVCHTFGNRTYDIDSTARDNWFAAILTNGEGYHNYHHHFPTDYRNGVRWYHWDPSKWAIALLEKTGLATGLRRTSGFQILRARLVAQKTLASRSLGQAKVSLRAARILEWNYRLLETRLQDWESASLELKQKAHRAFNARYHRWGVWISRF